MISSIDSIDVAVVVINIFLLFWRDFAWVVIKTKPIKISFDYTTSISSYADIAILPANLFWIYSFLRRIVIIMIFVKIGSHTSNNFTLQIVNMSRYLSSLSLSLSLSLACSSVNCDCLSVCALYTFHIVSLSWLQPWRMHCKSTALFNGDAMALLV